MRLLKFAIAALVLSPMLGGCVEHEYVYARSAPPGAVVVYERPGYVWVPGYYTHGHRVYVRGHYRRRY